MEELAASKKARKVAEGKAAASATQVVKLSNGPAACMTTAKEVLDSVLHKAWAISSEALPEASEPAFVEWLKTEVWLVLPMIDNVSDFGALGTALGVARSFQAIGCDHLKALGRVSHVFPSVDDVQGSV